MSIGVLALLVGGTRLLLSNTVDQAYSKHQVVANMRPIHVKIDGQVHKNPPKPPQPSTINEAPESPSRLEAIRQRGVLRVGYDPEGLPFSYFNQDGELVGFDIEMAQALANELEVDVEFFPYSKPQMGESLNRDRTHDLLVGGLFATTRRVEEMRFSAPYLDLHMSFITRDHRKQDFVSLAGLRDKRGLKIAVLERPYFGSRIKQIAPQAEIVLVDSPREYFESNESFDAIVMSAEAGSAWTLLYPECSVVVPQDGLLTVSVGYPMALSADRLESVVSRWIDLKRKNGTLELLHKHWIEGETAEDKSPRWNILSNVLGWNDGKLESRRTASR
jgi:ABC-type amino acid transport substrate-binding protein